jgi:hypothetical protein
MGRTGWHGGDEVGGGAGARNTGRKACRLGLEMSQL